MNQDRQQAIAQFRRERAALLAECISLLKTVAERPGCLKIAGRSVQWLVELVETATARLRSPDGLEFTATLAELTTVGGVA